MMTRLAFFFCCFILSTVQPLLCMHKRARTTSLEKSEQVKKPEKKRSTATTRYGRSVASTPKKMAPQELSLHHVDPLDTIKLKLYLAAGADVHEVVDGETPLHRFVRARASAGIQKLLLYGASLGDLTEKEGESALHMSARMLPDISKLLLTTPQGSPCKVTQQLETWQKSLLCFSCVLHRLGVPKDVRLIICQQMMPEPNQLINWVPLPMLPYYLNFYSEKERRHMLELFVRRHIVDTFQALRVQNRKHQTPYQVALSRVGLMGMFVPPVHLLDKNNSSALHPEIRTNYARLLDITG